MSAHRFPLALLSAIAVTTGCAGGTFDQSKSDDATTTEDGTTTDGDTTDSEGDGTGDGGDDGSGDDGTDDGGSGEDGSDDGSGDDTGGDTGDDTGEPSDTCGPPTVQHLVDTPDGPAYADVADIDGDGKLDLVVAAFGTFTGFGIPKGTVRLHRWGTDLSDWSTDELIAESDDVPFPNQPKAVDMDGDGDLDITMPTGFFVCSFIGGNDCGGVLWLEQTGTCGFVRREILPNDNLLFYHHMEVVDFDGDGIDDVVSTGEELAGFIGGEDRAETVWFKGEGGGEYDAEPLPISDGLGSFPQVYDVDGDGDLDVIGAEYFGETAASYAWIERTADPSSSNPSGSFERHVISDAHGKAIQFQLTPDLFGDGVLRALGSNHTNTASRPPDPEESALAVFTPGSDPTEPWSDTIISDGIVSDNNLLVELAAPGIFDYGDIDGDGDNDILLAGDGDPRVFWYEQTTPGAFTQHVLLEGMRQTGGARIDDIDGDGCNDLVVTSYEDNVVYVYGR